MRQAFVLLFILATVVNGSRPSHAQSVAVSVDVILDESSFLPGEDLPVGVRISNLSGRPLTLGSATNWVSFYIESKKGVAVTRLGPVPVQGEFTLDSSKAGTKWWNVQPYFEFEEPGLYLVSAELRLPDSNLRIVSDPVPFTMQSSRTLWDVSFGVPSAEGETNAAPEIRRYALQAATRAKERKLFLRVSDEAETRVFKVALLDRYLSFSNPQQQLDVRSCLHILFQTGGTFYTYCVANPNGEIILRQRHEITAAGRPRLFKTKDGNITVAGGKRTPSFADIPPWQPPASATTIDTNAPPKTNAPAADATKKSKSTKKK